MSIRLRAGKKNVRLLRITATGAAAGTIAACALAAPASAAPVVVHVPCHPAALSTAIAGAVSGETLALAASCHYALTAALPPVTVGLTIQGNNATLQRSTAAGTPAFAILTVTGSNADVSVSHLTLRNGSGGAISVSYTAETPGTLTATDDTFTGNTGGAINNGYFDLAVSHSTFTGNAGSAINVLGSFVGPTRYTTVTDSIFSHNAPGSLYYDDTGGAIDCLGPGCNVTVTGSTFTRNTGSAIALPGYTTGDIQVTHSVFTDNTGSDGGAIYINSVSIGGLTANDDIFTGNTATHGGGAIYDFDGLAATGDTFTKNSATGNGGAIDNEYGASVQGSTFRQNNAADGGALYNGDRISVTNSTFVQNKASDGGAIAQQNNGFGIDPALSITGSQILRNQATQYGGGISSAPSIVPPGLLPGPTTITTTTIRGNKAGTDGGGIEDTALRPITLTQSSVVGNHPDNCAPPQSVSGCVN
jgi:hypothetical protein